MSSLLLKSIGFPVRCYVFLKSNSCRFGELKPLIASSTSLTADAERLKPAEMITTNPQTSARQRAEHPDPSPRVKDQHC